MLLANGGALDVLLPFNREFLHRFEFLVPSRAQSTFWSVIVHCLRHQDLHGDSMRSKALERRDQMQRSGLVVSRKNGRSLPIAFVTRVTQASNTNSLEALDAAKHREVEFAQLPSGTLIDLIRDSSGKLSFAVFQNGMTSLQQKVQHGTLLLFPGSLILTFCALFDSRPQLEPITALENYFGRSRMSSISITIATLRIASC